MTKRKPDAIESILHLTITQAYRCKLIFFVAAPVALFLNGFTDMRKVAAFLFPPILLMALVPVAHSGLYRWVDADGNVHYSDSVPPDRVQSGHTELSEGGVRLRSIPKAKTPEEARKEKELERLRMEQEQLLEQQRSADRVLLRTFRSEDDIVMARDGKITAIDVMIDVTKNNIRRQQEGLVRLRTQAANRERAGKPIPQHLSDGITKTERAIRDSYATIIDREEQKSGIRSSFERDRTRFRQLKDIPASDSPVADEASQPILHNIVTCSGPEECNRLWEKATAYVRQHATTSVQADSDTIFITAPPATEQDVSLILSRISQKKGTGASLFLDLQCQRSVRGKEMCRGQRAQDIIQGFRPAITGEDAPTS